MKKHKLLAPVLVASVALLFFQSSNVAAKETGIYFHVGLAYWSDMETPAIVDFFELEDVQVYVDTYGTQRQRALGVGYNFNEHWGLEAFYLKTPKTRVSVIDEESFSWSSSIHQTVLGFSAVYDRPINKHFSLFGKTGIALLDMSASLKHSEVQPFLDSRDSEDIFAAVGVRIPFPEQYRATITGTYQMVNTQDGLETYFEVGVQLRL